jgi:UMF1 family MFS transporter
MVAVAVTSPFVGAVSDWAGWRKRLLITYTALSVIATGLLATVQPGMIIYGFILSAIAGFGFEGAMVFYNAYLPDLSPPERRGRLSGVGFAVGYAGSFIGLLAVLPLVNAEHYAASFALVALLFGVLAVPSFLWLPRDHVGTHSVWHAGRLGWSGAWATTRDVLRHCTLRRFLASYFLYADGVNTVIVFSSIFAKEVLGFAMTDLILVYIIVQVSALIGAALWARPTDTLGPKFVVMTTIIQWSIVVGLIYFVQSRTMFLIVAAIAGTGLGAIQSASRALMASMIPRGREGEFFGFYSLCGKASAVLGPLVFGEVAAATDGNLRLAALSILFFFVAGGVLLSTVRAGGPSAEQKAV